MRFQLITIILIVIVLIIPFDVLYKIFVVVLIPRLVDFIEKLYYHRENKIINLVTKSNINDKIIGKYLEFCELYIKELYFILDDIIENEIKFKNFLNYSFRLQSIRREYDLYIHENVNIRLLEFEKGFRKIGSKKHLLNSNGAIKCNEKRKEISNNLYNSLIKLINNGEEGSVDSIIRDIKDDLKIDEIYNLRKKIF